jgi:hypothetical protein
MNRKAIRNKDEIRRDLNALLLSKTKRTGNNPHMSDFKGAQHFKVTLMNRDTRKQATFNFSRGSANKDSVVYGLISCLLSDREYEDLDRFDELGYEGKKAIEIHQAICDNNEKADNIGLLDYFDVLSDDSLQIIMDGYLS